MFTAVIIDDEPLAVEAMRGLCERSSHATVVGEALDGASGLDVIGKCEPDAVFLDIGMPGLNGLEVAKRITALPRPPLVAFVTAYDHFATKAFDLAVIDYILKPIEGARLDRCFERITERLAEQRLAGGIPPPPDFWLPCQGGVSRVAASSIREVRAERDYVRIITEQRSFLLHATISALADRLDPDCFVRLHRSTILRTADIVRLEPRRGGRWSAVNQAGRLTPIGQSYLAQVRARLGVGALSVVG